MVASRGDLTIEQGTSWSAGWTFHLDGQPMFDHTATVRAQVRSSPTSEEVLHAWSSAANTAHVNDNGTVMLWVDPATSSAWSWSRGVYDLEVTHDGVVYRMLEGRVTVSREVTR